MRLPDAPPTPQKPGPFARRISLRRAIAHWAIAVCALIAGTAAHGEDWPARPVRIVVPFAPGGPDVIARLISQSLGARIGKPVVVENRPGANGIIGADLVAKSAPDGYTLMVTSGALVVNPSVYRKLPYDTLRDLVPITDLARIEGLLVTVSNDLPVHSLHELQVFGQQPGVQLSYGSPGVGNQLHVAGGLLNAQLGLHMMHVPYKGAGPAVSALVAGEIQVLLITPPMSLPYVRSGKIRALAFTGPKRAAFLADLPTMAEAGVPDFVLNGGWFGLFAPAGTPERLIARVYAEVKACLAEPAVRERIAGLGLEEAGHEPAVFGALVEADVRRYSELVRTAGITPE